MSYETYAPVWTSHIVGSLRISLLYVSGAGVNCVSCVISMYHLWFVCVFPGGIAQLHLIHLTLACRVDTDLIMRDNARTTTTTTTTYDIDDLLVTLECSY